MKAKSKIRHFLALAGSSLLAISFASSAELFWSANGTTQGGAGTWNTVDQNWGTATTGPFDSIWNNDNNDTARFGSTAGTVTLDNNVTVGGLVFNTNNYIIDPGTGPFGINFGASGDINVSTGTTIINAAISGGAITKTGGGVLRLTPANTFNGLNLNGGVVEVNGTTDSLGAAESTITVLGDSTLRQGGSGPIVLDKSLDVSSGTLTFVHGNSRWEILGVVSGSGTIKVNDAGSINQRPLTLHNTANTFTGTIDLLNNNSTITVGSLSDAAGSGNIWMATSAFQLGATADAPMVLTNRAFDLRSGTGRINNNNTASSSANTLTVNSDLIVTTAGNKNFQLGGTNTGTNTFAGSIGDSTHGSGGIVSFIKADAGRWILGNSANSYTGATIISAGTLEVTNLANGGGNSGIGSSTAVVNNLRFLANSTLRYSGSGGSTDRNLSLQGSATIDSSGAGPLVFTETGALSPDVTDLSGTFVENSAIVTVTSTANLAVGMTVISDAFTGTKTINAITSATSITLNNGTGVADGSFTLSAGIPVNRTLTLRGSNTGSNTIASVLQNSTAITTSSNGTLTLAKNDGGTWVLSGNNTYTGTTTINAGALQAIDGAGLPTTSILQLRGGVFQSSGTFTRNVSTAAGAVNWSTSSGGFAAIGGTLNLQLNGGTGSLTWNGSSMVSTGQTLIFGSTSAESLVDFQNALNLGSSGSGQRTIQVNDNPNSATDRARISGNITNTASGWGILKTGDGILELTGNNTYTGATTVSAGTLALAAPNVLPDVTNVSIDDATLAVGAVVTDTAGTLDCTAAAIINLGSGAQLAFADSSALGWTGSLTITGSFVSGSSLRFGDGSTDGLSAGQLASITATGYTGFAIDGSGFLTATLVGGSPYDTWSGGAPFDGDANGDGVSNGLAFLLGADGPNDNALGLLPTVTESGGNLVLSFDMLKPGNRGAASLSIEHSRDLGIADPWTTVAVPDSNGGPTSGVTFVVGTGAGTTNPVTATISASEANGTGKLFGRLKAENP